MDSPYNQGVTSFKLGLTLDDNPYEPGTVAYDSWNFGWDAGQEDSLREK